MSDAVTMPFASTTRTYQPRTRLADPRAAELPLESRAALRQFTLDRLVGYGVERADALELHELVLTGQAWQVASTSLAERCLQDAAGGGLVTRTDRLRRAAALLRMSQVMVLTDTASRRAIFARAADLFGLAATLTGDRSRRLFDTPAGPVAGWQLHAAAPAVAAVIVIGGVEGYAMDFETIGDALARSGIETFLVDAPGQGETRFTHSHYLTSGWRTTMTAVIDHVQAATSDAPIGIVGNSMGGSIAMAVAVDDERVRACVDNGGIPMPWMVPASIGTFFTKMVAFCGTDHPDTAIATWSTVTPLAAGPNAGYPLLVIHGAADPLVSQQMAAALITNAPTSDKEVVIFSDGDHCIYNHRADRDTLIADWMHTRLTGNAALN